VSKSLRIELEPDGGGKFWRCGLVEDIEVSGTFTQQPTFALTSITFSRLSPGTFLGSAVLRIRLNELTAEVRTAAFWQRRAAVNALG
jgi:hypothetical protein